MIMKKSGILLNLCSMLMGIVLLTGPISGARAESSVALSAGQTVYVPIYSHIYSGLKGRPFELAATLSIRNTDPKHPIELMSVKYFDSDGKLIKQYLDKSSELNAMATKAKAGCESGETRRQGFTAGADAWSPLTCWGVRV